MEYLSSWISPGAAFFLFVNVLIGAIVVTSRGGQQGGRAASTRRLCRSASSMVLDRLRSFSTFSFQFQPTTLEDCYDYTLELESDERQQQPVPPAVAGPLVTAPASVPPPRAAAAAADEASSKRAKEEEEGEAEEDESSISSEKADGPSSLQGGAEQSPSSGDAAVVVAAAEATTAAVAESQEAEVAGAAAVQRARACREEALEGKATLNARAELFIRQFKEDLKLQRLNSIMKYTRALRRGAGAAAPATAHQ